MWTAAAGGGFTMLSIAASAILMSATALGLQPPSASSQAASPAPVTYQTGAARLMALSRCVALARPVSAKEALGLPMLSAEQDEAVRKLVAAERGCGSQSVSALPPKSIPLVSGMSEGLFLSQFEKADPTSLVAASANLQARNGVEDVALCMVRKDPLTARKLIGSAPATPAEAAGITQMIPHLTACVPKGVTMSFGRPEVRGLSAAGLYMAAQRDSGRRICKADTASAETRLKRTICRTEREWENVRDDDLKHRRR